MTTDNEGESDPGAGCLVVIVAIMVVFCSLGLNERLKTIEDKIMRLQAAEAYRQK